MHPIRDWEWVRSLRSRMVPYIKSDYAAVARFQAACGVDTHTGARGYAPLHALFTVGAALGYEEFYITFLPFLFWGVLPMAGRRVMVLWGVSAYVGQLLKDILRLPRPGPPAVRLESLHALEFGMPSTHAMFGFSLPVALAWVLVSTMNAPPALMWTGCAVWASTMAASRLYLGVHSRPDIVVGAALGLLFSAVFVGTPIGAAVDDFLVADASSTVPDLGSAGIGALFGAPRLAALGLAHPLWTVLAVATGLTAAVPLACGTTDWTSTYADTVTILGACCGALMGASLYNGDRAALAGPWPGVAALAARVLFGFALLLAVRAVAKAISLPITSWAARAAGLGAQLGAPSWSHTYAVDIPARLFSYSCVGFAAVLWAPIMFQVLGV